MFFSREKGNKKDTWAVFYFEDYLGNEFGPFFICKFLLTLE